MGCEASVIVRFHTALWLEDAATRPLLNPPPRGVHGDAKVDCVTLCAVWLGNMKVIVSPTFAEMVCGTKEKPSRPTWTVEAVWASTSAITEPRASQSR